MSNWNDERDNAWFDDDWWDDEMPEPTMQELQEADDWYREMREDQLFDIELGQNVPWSKVRGFIEDAKGWKSYDTKNGGVDSHNRKRFCNYHGCQIQINNVDRIVASMAKPFASIASIEAKIKSNPKWKHNHSYRMVAGWLINDLREGDDLSYPWNHSPVLRNFMIVDNYVVLK